MATPLLQISINLSTSNTLHSQYLWRKPIICYSLTRPKVAAFHQNSCKLRAFREEREEGFKRKKRVVLVRFFNQGFGFNGGGGGSGGGGGGGGENNIDGRVVGNLALAIGLTYLTMTGQLGWVLDAIVSIWLGWVLDAIVSIWLLLVVVPIVGLGAFLWWAGRDIVQDSCPNCGNDFQILKSTLNEELQLCPYCSQPFSVVDDKFIRESVRFTNESSTFGQAFSDFFPGSKKGTKKGKESSAVVDVEAEIKDAD